MCVAFVSPKRKGTGGIFLKSKYINTKQTLTIVSIIFTPRETYFSVLYENKFFVGKKLDSFIFTQNSAGSGYQCFVIDKGAMISKICIFS